MSKERYRKITRLRECKTEGNRNNNITAHNSFKSLGNREIENNSSIREDNEVMLKFFLKQ